jgi:hypothetical protein
MLWSSTVSMGVGLSEINSVEGGVVGSDPEVDVVFREAGRLPFSSTPYKALRNLTATWSRGHECCSPVRVHGDSRVAWDLL